MTRVQKVRKVTASNEITETANDRGQGKEKEPIETCTPSQEDEVEADYTETKSFESTPNVITILDDE
ncbi:23079_t:CDS:2, partial [Rhizophagus irregularis]